jgi:hypothetical protein
MNGTRLGLYGPIKRVYGSGDGKDMQILTTVAAGATSGALGAFVGRLPLSYFSHSYHIK